MGAGVSEQTLEALRDFFLARDATGMRAAYRRLALQESEAPAAGDWSALEFAFNRLFVGPQTVPAPPYASVYLDAQPDLMGPTSLKIRHFYEALGLASPWVGSVPDDHIGLELDAWRQLRMALARVESDELQQAQGFLLGHLYTWLPLFASRVRGAPEVPEAILFVVSVVERVALQESEAATLSVTASAATDIGTETRERGEA
jgi:TorA maturation chaperone TorD